VGTAFALGVGEVKFFEKAFTRLKGVADRSSILFVASHAPDILRLLCNKAIRLQSGTLMAYGELNEVLGAYQGQPAADAARVTSAQS
jgi:ABC-type polysaccharide/polyol phosphate transport system ATPase subunit